MGPDHVIILDRLTSAGLEWAAQGATLLVLSSGDGSLGPLETLPSSYHPSWWTGNPASTTMGTVVYPGFDAIAPGMAPCGWCDAGWVKMLDASQVMMLDAFGDNANVDVLIRAIDLLGVGQNSETQPFRALSRDKILLWQAGIDGPPPTPSPPPAPGQKVPPVFPAKGGTVIMSSLNILPLMSWTPMGSSAPQKGQPGYQKPAPEAHHLLQRLIGYPCSVPRPRKRLRLKKMECPGCLVPSTWNVCPSHNASSPSLKTDDEAEIVRGNSSSKSHQTPPTATMDSSSGSTALGLLRALPALPIVHYSWPFCSEPYWCTKYFLDSALPWSNPAVMRERQSHAFLVHICVRGPTTCRGGEHRRQHCDPTDHRPPWQPSAPDECRHA